MLILSSDSLLIALLTTALFKLLKSLQFSINISYNYYLSITSHIPSLANTIIESYKSSIFSNYGLLIIPYFF